MIFPIAIGKGFANFSGKSLRQHFGVCDIITRYAHFDDDAEDIVYINPVCSSAEVLSGYTADASHNNLGFDESTRGPSQYDDLQFDPYGQAPQQIPFGGSVSGPDPNLQLGAQPQQTGGLGIPIQPRYQIKFANYP